MNGEDLSRPTMRDVAALARVGLKTVSRVINGEPGVSPELRARVQRAIEQLDYLPNLTASSLRRSSGRSATIGLILENIANPFSSGLHRAIGDVAWAPLVDSFLSRKLWYLIASILSAVGILATGLVPIQAAISSQ